MEIKLQNGKIIGDGHPTYIIAEVGINHNGDINIAKKLIDKASFLEIDAIKFQKRSLDEIYTKEFLNAPYQKNNSFGETYGQHKEFLEFSEEQILDLRDHAARRGIDFLVSGFDFKSFDFIEGNLNVPFHKIPSPYINHFPLLERVAKYGRPIVLSTGMHSLDEIQDAVNCIFRFNQNLVVMQCTTLYPCENSQADLKVIQSFRKELNTLVGYSSHDKGIILPVIASALGACVIEKHYTFDRTAPGPDHAASVETRGLELIKNYIRSLEEGMGDGIKKIYPAEYPQRIKYGFSIVSKYNLVKGTVLTEDMVKYKIPGGGFLPKELYKILGKTLLKDVSIDEQLTESILE